MINDNLKRLREEKGISKLELARRTSLSARIIEFIEHGKVMNPRLSTMQSIATALDVSIEELTK